MGRMGGWGKWIGGRGVSSRETERRNNEMEIKGNGNREKTKNSRRRPPTHLRRKLLELFHPVMQYAERTDDQ